MRQRLALIGCGRILRKHLDAIEANKDHLELVGVCDLKEDRLQAAVEKSGVKGYADHIQMVKELKPDIVSILTESGSHAKVCIDCAPYCKNIIVEKPMALSLTDADAMIESCEHAGTRLFVVKQNRYNKAVRLLRRALEEGRFGKLVMGTVRVRWCRTQKYYDQDPWRGTWAEDGGVYSNQASHHIDLLRWMMGDVESIQSYTTTRLVNIECEDTGVGILRFTNGALGVVETTTATRPKDLEGSISILGENGSVVVGGFAVNRIDTWNFVDEKDYDKDALTASENPSNVYGFGHIEFYRDILDCIETGKRPMLDGLEGRKSLELIVAMYQAAATRQEVRMRYIPEHVPLGRRREDG